MGIVSCGAYLVLTKGTAESRNPDGDSGLEPEVSGSVFDNLAKARGISDLELLRNACIRTGYAAYKWNTLTGNLTWSSNAAEVLGCAASELPRTGAALGDLVNPDNRSAREELIFDNLQPDDGDGIKYHTSYMLHPDAASAGAVAIEEHGWVLSSDTGETIEVIALVRKQSGAEDANVGSRLTDTETGLASREGILELLSSLLAHQEQSSGLLVGSVSNIHKITETFGSEVVPEVIRAVAARLRSVMRGVDTLGRTSQTGLAIVLRECTSEQIQVASQRFMAAIRDDAIATPHGPVWVEFSVGGIVIPLATDDATEAMALAEDANALARNSEQHWHLAVQHSSHRADTHNRNRQNANEIIEALNSERFTLWHQPIVTRDGRETVMYESLLRMRTLSGDIVPAAHLIPLAEKLGFMHMIDAMVCRSNLELVKKRSDVAVSFNISRVSLENGYALARIVKLVADAGDAANRLCAEVNIGPGDLEMGCCKLLNQLRALGCRIALSGYLSNGVDPEVLANVDLVKLDGKLCLGISERPADVALLKAAIGAAHAAGCQVIAEHIENEADATVLSECGADYLQGFLIGKVSPDHFHLVLSKLDRPADVVDIATETAAVLADLPNMPLGAENQVVASTSIEPDLAIEADCDESDGNKPSGEVSGDAPDLQLLKSAIGILDSI